jgi:hypothetical protein|eukprot:SAG25_NODE_2_length_31535_cov_18.197322_10_plen_200_part_00
MSIRWLCIPSLLAAGSLLRPGMPSVVGTKAEDVGMATAAGTAAACVIVLCGAPAAGKSTLACQLCSSSGGGSGPSWRPAAVRAVHHICYDDIERETGDVSAGSHRSPRAVGAPMPALSSFQPSDTPALTRSPLVDVAGWPRSGLWLRCRGVGAGTATGAVGAAPAPSREPLRGRGASRAATCAVVLARGVLDGHRAAAK